MGFLVSLPYFSQFHQGLADEAVLCLGAEGLLRHEYLYQDFQCHLPPGIFLLTAGAFQLGGVFLAMARLLMLVSSAGLSLLVYLLSRTVMPMGWAVLASVFFSLMGVTQYPVLNHHWWAALFWLLHLWLMLRWWERPSLRLASGIGVALALCGWILQSYILVALVTTCAVGVARRPPQAVRQMGILVSTCLLASLVLWAPILCVVNPQQLWRETVVHVFENHLNYEASPYTLAHLTQRWSSVIDQARAVTVWNAASLGWGLQVLLLLGVLTVQYAGYFPLLLLALGLAWRKLPATPRILASAQLLLTLVCRYRLDLTYLNYLTPVWYVLIVWVMYSMGRAGRLVAGSLLVLWLAHFALDVRQAADYQFPIYTVRGTLYANEAAQAGGLNVLLKDLSRRLPPKSRLFAYPNAGILCFLCDWHTVRFFNLPPFGEVFQEQARAARSEFTRLGVTAIVRLESNPEGLSRDYPAIPITVMRESLEHYDRTFLEGLGAPETMGFIKIYPFKD